MSAFRSHSGNDNTSDRRDTGDDCFHAADQVALKVRHTELQFTAADLSDVPPRERRRLAEQLHKRRNAGGKRGRKYRKWQGEDNCDE